MVVDFLRSFHVATANIALDGVFLTKLRWKPASSTAKPLPFFTWSGSPVWEPGHEDEVEGPLVYREPLTYCTKVGLMPAGDHWHGNREWLENGIPLNVLDNLPDAVDNTCYPRQIGVTGVAFPGVLKPGACRYPAVESVTVTYTDRTGWFAANFPSSQDVNVYSIFAAGFSAESDITGHSPSTLFVEGVCDSDNGKLTISTGNWNLIDPELTYDFNPLVTVETDFESEFNVYFSLTSLDYPLPTWIVRVLNSVGDTMTISLDIAYSEV